MASASLPVMGEDMGQGVAQGVPSVEEVARLVDELVRSQWPTTEEERAAWFQQHGLVAQSARLVSDEHGTQSWLSGDPAAGWPAVGWHVFEGEFVGVSWFLWPGLGEDLVPGLAEELRARLVGIAGAPTQTQRRDGGDYRFSASWQTGGRDIEMYLHGSPVLEGQLHEQPVVQLHLDHAGRASRAEATARRSAAGR